LTNLIPLASDILDKITQHKKVAYVICVFCLLVVLVRLSVPVQVTDWKDSSLKWPIMCSWGR